MIAIKFEDIKVGDDITATLTQRGVTVTRRGVVEVIYTTGAHTAEGGYIAGSDNYTYTLNHRPMPAEPKGLGAVVRAKVAASTSDPRSVRTLVRSASSQAPWIDDFGFPWKWSDFDPDTIEVLRDPA